jgi:hypothetical protein
MGKAYSENVQNGTCYSYILQEEEQTGVEIYISKRELANMSYSVLICGNSVANVYKFKTLMVSPEVLKQQCQSSV